VHACGIANVAPADTVMIGDAERDIQSGVAAGTHTIAAAYGYIPPEEDPASWGADTLVKSSAEIYSHLWS